MSGQLETIGLLSGLLDLAIGPSGPHLAIGPSGSKIVNSCIFGCAWKLSPNPSGTLSDLALVKSQHLNGITHQHPHFDSHLDFRRIGPICFVVGSGHRHPIWKMGGSGQSGYRAHRAPQMRASEIPSGSALDRASRRAREAIWRIGPLGS